MLERPRRRGRALAIADLGNSVGTVLLVPMVPLVISALEWRGTWMALGILTTVITLPAALLMRRQPEDYGLQPDGVPLDDPTPGAIAEHVAGGPAPEPEWTRGQAIRTPAFWLLILAFSAAGPGVMGVSLHQIPHITDRGFSETQTALTLTVWALCAGFSRVGFGFLVERIQIRYLMVVVMMVGSGAGVALLLWLPNLWVLYLFAVVYGLMRGPFVIMNSLVWADYFGRRHLGSIRGMMAPFNAVSFAGGPLLAGFLFDRYGDYALALQLFIGGYLLSGLLLYLVRPPAYRPSLVAQT